MMLRKFGNGKSHSALICILLLISFVNNRLHSQNLVPNPSFELGRGPDCEFPTSSSYTFNVAGFATGWNCPTSGTSDLFSDSFLSQYCFSNMPSTNPDAPGFQLPRTGHSLAGLITGGDIYSGTNYREYLEVQLTQPLEVGSYYQASMYVSLAEGPPYASNNLGMYFSDTKVLDYTTEAVLNFSPQVNCTNVVLDSINWYKVCGTFKATSAAQYLILGNFFKGNLTTLVHKTERWKLAKLGSWAYYYIDDITVEKYNGKLIENLPVNSTSTSVCQNETVQLTATGTYESITWSTYADSTKALGNTNSFSISPQNSTTYLVKSTLCGINYRDTLTVTVHPLPKINLGPDSTLCNGATKLLMPGNGYKYYLWQDGSTQSSYLVTHAGKYHVKVQTEYGCGATDEIALKYIGPPKVDLGRDTLECTSFKPLTAYGNKSSRYSWSTGESDSIIIPQYAGKYWVRIKNQCGLASDTVTIYSSSEAFLPNVLTLNGDTLNSKFKITGIGDTPFSLTIVNRWGEQLFEQSPYKKNWPPNDDLPADTYYYLVSFRGCGTQKGWIQILH